MLPRAKQDGLLTGLLVGSIALGLGIVVMTILLFLPAVRTALAERQVEERKPVLPAVDYAAWRGFVVQEGGRKKPFETFAIESLRQVTGRSTFQGEPATKIVLSWMLLSAADAHSPYTNWEKYPFILCDHHDLRAVIFRDLVGPDRELTEEQKHGKYIAPEHLRQSQTLYQLLLEADEIEEQDREKASRLMKPLHRKAREVAGRLALYDSISQNTAAVFGAQAARRMRPDPVHLVALDRIAAGGWFSVTQLKNILREHAERQKEVDELLKNPAKLKELFKNELAEDPAYLTRPEFQQHLQEYAAGGQWRELMRDRLARSPQLYLKPEFLQELKEFQESIKAGTADQKLDELDAVLRQRREQLLAQLERIRQAEDEKKLLVMEDQIAQAAAEKQRVEAAKQSAPPGREQISARVDALAAILDARDKEIIADLKRRVAAATKRGYHPEEQEYRMLHLNYLESRFPTLYRDSAAWQPFPAEQAQRVVSAYEALQKAYASGDASQFQEATSAFFDTVAAVSREYDPAYPGADTIALEMTYNRVQPFMWGWIIMLAALVLLIVGMSVPGVTGQAFYAAALLAYLTSLGFQAFGFYARVVISGRAPVTNMYETVIFVAAMSAVFALVLELIYRRKIIALAGAFVSMIGLILADQTPTVLDPKISPLVPVLRSNFWLIIHVLTIVSSYAGATLAWGLGNIVLGLMAFGTPRRDVLKTLSLYTYRAIQIAVLLLAAGTFLGGWWAAESWGRFWGWDP